MLLNILIICNIEERQKLLAATLMRSSLNIEQINTIDLKSNIDQIEHKNQEKIIFFDVSDQNNEKIIFKNLRNNFKNGSIIILSDDNNAIKNLDYLGLGASDVILLNNLTVFNLEKSVRQAIRQKKIEASLQFSNDRYRLVSKTTSDMVWDWDLLNNKLFRSETGWKKILGADNNMDTIDPTEIVDPDSWRDRIHIADKMQSDKVIANILEDTKETNFELEYRIRKNDNSYAIILDKGYVIRNENGEATRLVGAATDFTGKRMLEQKIALERSQKTNEITSAVITAQEHERAEIGKELHDNINQLLATSKLYIEFALSKNIPNADLLISAKGFIETAVAEIRLLTKALMPPTVGVNGLTMALQELVDNLKKITLFTIHTNWQQLNEIFINEPLKLTIFRIVQEQINNVIKHAKASDVWIFIEQDSKQITLKIKDNGVGFDKKTQKEGVGLKNIHSRTHLHNGSVKLVSQIQKGCSLSVHFKL